MTKPASLPALAPSPSSTTSPEVSIEPLNLFSAQTLSKICLDPILTKPTNRKRDGIPHGHTQRSSEHLEFSMGPNVNPLGGRWALGDSPKPVHVGCSLDRGNRDLRQRS